MAIFRCKMCGGDLEVTEGSSSCACEFCGTKQTLPTITDEALQSLFNRANVLRMKSEFDKAADVYEKILQRSEQEAEAYWGLILCKYGIEYVEDPATFKRVPTCHRASYDAVTADEDYKNALRYADPARRSLYEAEAAAIDEIQRGIIALAQKEDPYDVFICYKETDESGKRTQDSVIANDIYHQLTMEGFKVFYAAITLEDKLGKEYEPYIFSALNTAKVMLALGTKPEYFSAVWVRNEWSRFLKIMKKDRTKLLIPCYRDMDPYELPEEFAHLQAQDMSKIGFISDLTRGIRKVLVKEPEQPKVQETVVIPQQSALVSGTTAAAQIKRGNMALEDHEWEKADDFFEEALNLDPECAEAYIGKLLAQDEEPDFASWVAVQKEKYASATTERLEACPEDKGHIEMAVQANAVPDNLAESEIRNLYTYDRTYTSALSCRRSQKTNQLSELKSDRLLARVQQYAAEETQKRILDGIAEITAALDQRIAKAEEEDKASITRIKAAYESHLKRADEKATALRRDAEERQEDKYRESVERKNNAKTIEDYQSAQKQLEAMNGYKDAAQLAAQCEQEAARKARKQRAITILVVLLVMLAGAGYWAYQNVIIPNQNYSAATALMESEKYEEAIKAFEAMDGYRDSAEQVENCREVIREQEYNAAKALFEAGSYEEAIAAFEGMDGYRDSAEQVENCREAIREQEYNAAKALYDSGKYAEAYTAFLSMKGYKDVDTLLSTDDNLIAAATAAAERKAAFMQVGNYVTFGSYEQDNNTTNGQESIEWQVLKVQGSKVLLISRYGLDAKPYNTTWTDMTWEKCSLRTWLNKDFRNAAFTAEEQTAILTTNVDNSKSQSFWSSNGDSNTQDRIFLLSYAEANRYFGVTYDKSSNMDSRIEPTAYAIARGAYTSDSNKTVDGAAAGWWWLRSSGIYRSLEAYVGYDGSLDFSNVSSSDGCVRPAFWINLDELP